MYFYVSYVNWIFSSTWFDTISFFFTISVLLLIKLLARKKECSRSSLIFFYTIFFFSKEIFRNDNHEIERNIQCQQYLLRVSNLINWVIIMFFSLLFPEEKKFLSEIQMDAARLVHLLVLCFHFSVTCRLINFYSIFFSIEEYVQL